MKVLYTLINLLITFSSIAQECQFTNSDLITKDFNVYNQRKIIIDGNNCKYLIGTFKDTISINTLSIYTEIVNLTPYALGVFIAKYDSSDNLILFKKLCESDTLGIFNAKLLDNGSIILSVSYNHYILTQNDSTFSNGGTDICSFCFDTNMQLKWKYNFGGINNEEIYYNTCTSDGQNIYLTGFFNHTSSGTSPNYKIHVGSDSLVANNMDMFIVKIDSNGNPVMGKSFGGGGADAITAIKFYKNSLYILGSLGAMNNTINGIIVNYPVNYSNRALVAKLDTNGNIDWIRKCGDDNSLSSYMLFDLAVTDDKVIFTGKAISNNQNIFLFEAGTTLYGAPFGSGCDFFIACYDTAGIFKWNTMSNSSGDELLLELNVDGMGNILGVGNINDLIKFLNDTCYVYGSSDAFVCSYTKDGVFNWAVNGGGIGSDIGNSISFDLDNKPYIVGGTSSATCYFGNDTLYTSNPSTMFLASIDTVAPLNINYIEKQEFNVYPNPVSHYFAIDNIPSETKVALYSSIGELVLPPKKQQGVYDVSYLPDGIYFLSLQIGQNRYNKKISIQH